MFTELNTTEVKVLEPFFADPALEASIREISRRSEVSPKWVSKTVSKLEESSILQVEETTISNNVSAGQKFRDMKRIYNLDSIQDSGLIEFLDEELRPDAIVLFGSYEKGEDSKNSDIDIAIVNGREKDLDLSEFEAKLNRAIETSLIRGADSGDKNFRNSIANGTILKGYLKVV